MTRYTRQGPFTTDGPPGLTGARLNAIEDGIIEAFGEARNIADYNLAVEPGIYRGGTTAANRPDDDWYVMQVYVWKIDPADSPEVIQVANSITTNGKVWRRIRNGVGAGVWSAWTLAVPQEARRGFAFSNNWRIYAGGTVGGTGYPNASYWKDRQGVVHFEGLLDRNGTAAVGNELIAQLPAGYRPQGQIVLNCMAEVGGNTRAVRLNVMPDGSIAWSEPAMTPTWVSIQGHNFREVST